MEYNWRGKIRDLKGDNFAALGPDLNSEDQQKCLAALIKLPYPDMEIVLGLSYGSARIHCLLLCEEYWVILRFAPGENILASDRDILAVQARTLFSADALQGAHRIFSALVLLDAKVSVRYGQSQALSPAFLPDYVTALHEAVKKNAPSTPMPDLSAIEVNSDREQKWDDKRYQLLYEMTSALFDAYLSSAKESAKELQRVGQALYICKNLEQAKAYLKKRHANADLLISPKARNLSAFRKENQQTDFAQKRPFALIAWGDDLRWLGRWKAAGEDESERHQTFERYRAMLCSGILGTLIYIPPSADMLGTYRAMEDAGFLPLQ